MDAQSVEDIIRYALMAASQEDGFYERQLGPIHFIKYVYLADMEHAKYHGGRTFTGVQWTFHKFGPWSQDVNLLIEPALAVLGATRKQQSSAYGDSDYIRWRLDDGEAAQVGMAVSTLPLEIKAPIGKYVHEYGNDTSALLHFVYATAPMLAAAPGEVLDFSVMVAGCGSDERGTGDFSPFLDRLPRSRRKQLQSCMNALRESFRKRLDLERAQEAVSPRPEYDAVYEEGRKWLDGLTGTPFPAEGVDVTIDETVWKSEARRGSERLP